MNQNLKTNELWAEHGSSLYFFILKRTRNTAATEDILQNTFLKVHERLDTLKDPAKAKVWIFQIGRNETANYFQANSNPTALLEDTPTEDTPVKQDFCCFERFIDELPDHFQKAIRLVYVEGKTNAEAATQLGLSLANVKAQLRRSKTILKKRFQECCAYEINEAGKLVGEPDCDVCSIA